MCVPVPALGDFDEPQRSSITMFGVLTTAVRIYQDRWGYGIYSGPIGSAVFIITVKWVSGLKNLQVPGVKNMVIYVDISVMSDPNPAQSYIYSNSPS